MSNPFKNQYTADGIGTDFVYSFAVPINRAVLVYETLAANQADEDADLVSDTLYTIIPDNPSSATSTGIVRFNSAPADQSIITITPDQATLVTYVFSNTAPFNTDNLNGSFEQEAQTNGYNLQNFLENSIRYNVNENDGNLAYDNKVSPLADNGFWRRVGAEIVSQDFDEFVGEVSAIVVGEAQQYVDAGADNTNLSHAVASNDQGVPYSGNPQRVDPMTGQVINDPAINGFSAKAGALWAEEWAQSANPINDDYGNSGRSARFYSDQASIAASNSGGVLDQLRIFDDTNTTTTVDLINYSLDPDEPWIDVLQNSLSVYVDGVRLQEPTAYSPPSTPATTELTYTVNIQDPPTLINPSSITFSSPVAANTEIFIIRSEPQGSGTGMNKDYSNAQPAPESDINASQTKAGLFLESGIANTQPITGDWHGGYTIENNDGVDSASVQHSFGIEADGSPNLAFRTNLTLGNTTLNPANFSEWFQVPYVNSTGNLLGANITAFRYFDDPNRIAPDDTIPFTNFQVWGQTKGVQPVSNSSSYYDEVIFGKGWDVIDQDEPMMYRRTFFNTPLTNNKFLAHEILIRNLRPDLLTDPPPEVENRTYGSISGQYIENTVPIDDAQRQQRNVLIGGNGQTIFSGSTTAINIQNIHMSRGMFAFRLTPSGIVHEITFTAYADGTNRNYGYDNKFFTVRISSSVMVITTSEMTLKRIDVIGAM